LLQKLLCSKPPSSYCAATSELLCRLNFKTDRASVRRWAIHNQLAPDTRFKARPKPVKRWQARDLGALWQYDASPHCWLPAKSDKQVLLNILDDATRYNVGARLYLAKNLLAHLHQGKIERRHDFWQKRLPALLAADDIRDLETANQLLDQLLPHVNLNEVHRELTLTPHAARSQAIAEKRSACVPSLPVVVLCLDLPNQGARR
jgi:transposase InsO family protein